MSPYLNSLVPSVLYIGCIGGILLNIPLYKVFLQMLYVCTDGSIIKGTVPEGQLIFLAASQFLLEEFP